MRVRTLEDRHNQLFIPFELHLQAAPVSVDYSELIHAFRTHLLFRAQRRQAADVAGAGALRQQVQAQEHPSGPRKLERHLPAGRSAAEAAPVDLAPTQVVAQQQLTPLTAGGRCDGVGGKGQDSWFANSVISLLPKKAINTNPYLLLQMVLLEINELYHANVTLF